MAKRLFSLTAVLILGLVLVGAVLLGAYKSVASQAAQFTFNLIPPYQAGEASVGETVDYTLTLLNQFNHAETFSLTYAATWPITGPETVGPIPGGQTLAFMVSLAVPGEANCYQSDVALIEALALTELMTDTAQIETEVVPNGTGGIQGTVLDANTGAGIPDAYVFLQLENEYYDTFADATGAYSFSGIPSGCTYGNVPSAAGYQFEYPPLYHTPVEPNLTVTADLTITAPLLSLSQDSLEATLTPGETYTMSLWVTNSGTADLSFGLDAAMPLPLPPVGPLALPFGDTKVDPRLRAALEEGDGRADILVIMAEQADLRAAYQLPDWVARGQYVYHTLKETAERTQAGIQEFLLAQHTGFRTYYALNSLLIYEGEAALLDALAARPEIGYLTVNGALELEENPGGVIPYEASAEASTVEWGVARVQADDVWLTYGITGTGIVVANTDTGVAWTHDALVSQYRGGPGNHDYNWFMPTLVPECGDGSEPCDNGGHGTHTMGTMLGDDGGANQIGVAPGAQWIACKGCEYNTCSYEALLACGDWMVAPTDLSGNNPNPDLRPNVINNSWGGSGGDFWFAPVVSAWRAAGMFPLFPGGNAGPTCSTTYSPGDYWLSYSAAAVAQGDTIASFSSRGPADLTGLIKPDLSAPGVNIRSSVPGNTYAFVSGTNRAAAHVAGVVALLWAADPELIGDIETTMALLSQTAEPLFLPSDPCGGSGQPNNVFGWGMVDAYAAVTEALAGEQTIPWLEVSPDGGLVAPGQALEVQIVFQAPSTFGAYTGTLQMTANEPYQPQVQIPVRMEVSYVDFIAQPTAGIVPLTVQFTDLSLGNFDSWAWDFGDSLTSTFQNPTHTFTSPGAYTITLTVSSAFSGTSTLIRPNYITVYEPPVANFVSDLSTGIAPLTVQFTDLSTGDLDVWLWDFGDGLTSTLQSPTHTYSLGGVYPISLTVSGPGGTDTLLQPDYLTVYDPALANFTADVSAGISSVTVQFTDLSTGDLDTWLWDFGDGITSTLQNPTHTFATVGVYTVSLTVSGLGGIDTLMQPDYIAVYEPALANFTADVTSGLAPLSVQFTDLSTGDLDTWLWDFGDGITSTLQSPGHLYMMAGTYTITLTVSGLGGTDSQTRSAYITVEEPEDPYFEIYLPIVVRLE